MCTATNQRSEVERIVQLGVSGYLIKSMDTESMVKRVASALEKLAAQAKGEAKGSVFSMQSKEDEKRPGGSRSTDVVLVADKELSFRKAVRGILSRIFKVVETETDQQTIRICLSELPNIVILGEVSGVLSLEMFSRKMADIAAARNIRTIRVFSTASFLASEQDESPEDSPPDGELSEFIRTSNPKLLEKRLRRVIHFPDFTFAYENKSLRASLRNYFPRKKEDYLLLKSLIAERINSDTETMIFDLADWKPAEPEPDEEDRVGGQAEKILASIIGKIRRLEIEVEVDGYEPSAGGPLASVLAESAGDSSAPRSRSDKTGRGKTGDPVQKGGAAT